MKTLKTLKRCFNLCKSHMRTIVLVSIFAIILDAIALLKPYLIKIIIDNFLSLGIYQKGFYTVTTIGVFYLLICIGENILDFISQTMTNVMGEKILFNLRNRLFKFTQNANVTFHDEISSGTIFVRIINDVDDISSLFKEVIATIFRDMLSIVTTIGIMIYFSYKLSMYAFIVLPFVILSAIIFTKALDYIYTKSNNIRTKLNTFLAESIYGAKLIKIFNIQKEMKDDCKDMADRFFYTRFPSSIFEALFPGFMILFENIAISIIVYTVLKGYIGDSIQVGFIYIFITYIRNLFEPVTRMIDNVEIIQEAGVSINKIYDILDKTDSQENLSEGEELKYVKGKLEFKHVWFKYKKSTHWILQDISFTIEPGETIALVGRTGSGKTTITNLVNRFYDVTKGEILLDGKNINEYSKKTLRKRVGTILQDPFVFAKSIRDNIRLNEEISDSTIYKAIEASSSKDFISSLPDGIDTVSLERGESFSAGEKQLLAFARIFAHDPDIFILDEATANIDTNTESLIQKSINKLSKEKTAIFIAHRLSTIVNVDKILVLQDGKIIEEGTHKQLLRKKGYYSKLYNSFYESLG